MNSYKKAKRLHPLWEKLFYSQDKQKEYLHHEMPAMKVVPQKYKEEMAIGFSRFPVLLSFVSIIDM